MVAPLSLLLVPLHFVCILNASRPDTQICFCKKLLIVDMTLMWRYREIDIKLSRTEAFLSTVFMVTDTWNNIICRALYNKLLQAYI